MDKSINDTYGIIKLDIEHCQNYDDCFIIKGKSLNIKSLIFIPSE